MIGSSTLKPKYTPFYCEENIWHLASSRSDRESLVVFLSNARFQIPLWMQRASQDPSQPVVWDYHVILLEKKDDAYQVWDLDSSLPCPTDVTHYVEQSVSRIENLPEKWHIQFRVIPSQSFLEMFSSDRSHMKDSQTGQWIKEPPPWPPIQSVAGGHNLRQFIEMKDAFIGDVLSERMFIERYCR